MEKKKIVDRPPFTHTKPYRNEVDDGTSSGSFQLVF